MTLTSDWKPGAEPVHNWVKVALWCLDVVSQIQIEFNTLFFYCYSESETWRLCGSPVTTMTWRHVIKSLLFKPDSQLCVIFTQFTPAFTPRRVELRIVVLFLSLFSRGEAKDQLSVSVVVCLSLSVVVQVWINSEVCPPSWTLLSGAETKLLWPALMKTGRDVTLDCYHGNSHIFTLCLLCVCRWQQPWWRFWSLLVWRLMGWVVKTLVLPSAPQGLLHGSRSWLKTLTGSWPPSNPGLRSSRGWTCWTMPSGSAKRMYHDGELNTYTHTHTRVMHCGLPVARLQTVLRSWSVPQ